MRTLARSNIPLITIERSDLTSRLADDLRQLDADVLVSVAFPYLIPNEVISIFPHGGVNMHPALLPRYRGPHPVPVMVLDDALSTAAGVTLHRISDRFDEGDIIAQVATHRFEAEDFQSVSLVNVRAGAQLLADALPRFCAGEISPTPQAAGTWRYARLTPDDQVVTPECAVRDIARRARMLGPLGLLRLEIGSSVYRIGGLPRRWQHTRLPAGNPHRVTSLSIEFDAADGRLRLLRRTGLLKTCEDWLVLLRLRHETALLRRGR
jgi:methionyl-tRNA formyltransferase